MTRTIDRRNFLAATAALALSASTANAQAPKPIPVIFHTDIGGDVDDTWALLLLLRHPALDLRLCVTETGNALARARLTAKLLTLAGRTDIPIAMGPGPGDNHGPQDAWIGDYSLDSYPNLIHTDAAAAMIATVMASPDPVTIISVGPVPVLAEALKIAPALARRARFVGMQGAVRVGYGGSAKIDAEYNVKTDPAALQAVFAADWLSCAITPLDTCGLVVIDGDDLQKLRASTDPFAHACIANSEAWLPNAPWMPKDFDLTKQSSTQFDSVAVTMAWDESDLVMETLPLRVTDDGMTIIDPVHGRPVRVASAWKDLAGFKRKMVSALTERPA